jgi:hypothetical protein
MQFYVLSTRKSRLIVLRPLVSNFFELDANVQEIPRAIATDAGIHGQRFECILACTRIRFENGLEAFMAFGRASFS